MDRNTKAWLSYLTWIAGIIIFASNKDSFIRENAAQSIILGVASTLIVSLLGWIPIIGVIARIVGIVYIVLAVLAALSASRGQTMQIPYVTDFARKMAG